MTRISAGKRILAIAAVSVILPIACNNDSARNEPASASMMGLQRAGTEYSELPYPLPSVPPARGRKLPPPDGHNVVWYKDNGVVCNPDNVAGVVGRHVAGEIEIATKEGNRTLQYSIPGVKMLPMKNGEKVSFAFGRGSALSPFDFIIVDSVGQWLCHASCRVTGDSELIVELTNGITISQQSGGESTLIGGNRVRHIPVKLRYFNNEVTLDRTKPVTILLGGRHYSVRLQQSIEQRPEGENNRYSEWQGYSLECIITSTDSVL